MASIPSTNSLGLDFDAPQPPVLTPENPSNNTESQPAPLSPAEQSHREKKKPYVNPDRVKTGGPQREKLTDEELAERMARMREQNEKIKQRRLDVAADEAAFKQTQEAERQKVERTKKIQENIDKAREQNVKRKMDKVQNREWDTGKPSTSSWKNQSKKSPANQEPNVPGPGPTDESSQPTDLPSPQSPGPTQQSESGNWVRGAPPRSGRGRGRGRGRGGRGAHANSRSEAIVTAKGQETQSPPQETEEKEVENTNPPAPS